MITITIIVKELGNTSDYEAITIFFLGFVFIIVMSFIIKYVLDSGHIRENKYSTDKNLRDEAKVKDSNQFVYVFDNETVEYLKKNKITHDMTIYYLVIIIPFVLFLAAMITVIVKENIDLSIYTVLAIFASSFIVLFAFFVLSKRLFEHHSIYKLKEIKEKFSKGDYSQEIKNLIPMIDKEIYLREQFFKLKYMYTNYLSEKIKD